uniref:CHASE2 domain-containing protein n=1 Tax=Limnohabitans sp. TaxID=1907725 RepID=UPI004047932D
MFVLPPLTALDRVAYDYLISTNPPTHNAVERVVILDVDEKSLSNPNLGRWPWSRDVMSDVVALLFQEYKVRVLGFDVVFSEPDTSSGLRALDALAAGPLANNPAYIESLEK